MTVSKPATIAGYTGCSPIKRHEAIPMEASVSRHRVLHRDVCYWVFAWKCMTPEVVLVPTRPPRKNIKRKAGVGLKRKPRSLKRRTAVSSRKKKTPEAKLKAKLWELCKQIIRKRYGNTCFTCEKVGLAGADWHTGHFIPRSICGAYLRYDLRNLRPQCFRCNINLAGNGSAYYRRLVTDLGLEAVDELFTDKEKITKVNKAWFEEKIAEYETILTAKPPFQAAEDDSLASGSASVSAKLETGLLLDDDVTASTVEGTI